MSDLELTRSGEMMVVVIDGLTEAGIAFVDSYNSDGEMVVIDSGRIIIRERDADQFLAAARERGLDMSAAEAQ